MVPSTNHYPYSAHLFLLLTVQESGGLHSSFRYWMLRNLVKLHLFAPSVLHPGLSNFLKNSCWSSLLHAETKNLFSRFQAGFGNSGSCEDQIPQIVKAIEDNFHQRPMQSSVLTLLDFSKAYDKIWRERLLLNMLDAGILSTFIRWLRSFLKPQSTRPTL